MGTDRTLSMEEIVVVLSKYFQDYYRGKPETKNRVGQQPRRKENPCTVTIKLIKVIFSLLRDKRKFDDGGRVIWSGLLSLSTRGCRLLRVLLLPDADPSLETQDQSGPEFTLKKTAATHLNCTATSAKDRGIGVESRVDTSDVEPDAQVLREEELGASIKGNRDAGFGPQICTLRIHSGEPQSP